MTNKTEIELIEMGFEESDEAQSLLSTDLIEQLECLKNKIDNLWDRNFRDSINDEDTKALEAVIKSLKFDGSPIGDYVTNLTTDELIEIDWNPRDYSDTLCNVCAEAGDCTDATHESHNMELCYDCWSEINE